MDENVLFIRQPQYVAQEGQTVKCDQENGCSNFFKNSYSGQQWSLRPCGWPESETEAENRRNPWSESPVKTKTSRRQWEPRSCG